MRQKDKSKGEEKTALHMDEFYAFYLKKEDKIPTRNELIDVTMMGKGMTI